jgi:hypothetical protein
MTFQSMSRKNSQPVAVVVKYTDYQRLKSAEPELYQAVSRERKESWETELVAMAADPEIQTEMQKISEEFAAAETDGL